MTIELTRRLLEGGLVRPKELELALLHSAVKRVPLLVTLLEQSGEIAANVERALQRADGLSVTSVVPVPALCEALPTGLCAQLLAVPVRQDPITRTVDVAVADPYDQHISQEIAFHLEVPVRLLRAPVGVITQALATLPDEASPPARKAGNSDHPLLLVKKAEGSKVTALTELDDDEDDVVLDLTRPKPHEPAEAHVVRGARDLDSALEELRELVSADEVAAVTAAHACPEGSTLVFAVKKDGFVALAASFEVDGLSDLMLDRDRPSVLNTAVEAGNYLGPLPSTLVHALMRDILATRLGNEVYAVPASVNGRPTLIVVSTGFERSFVATGRIDRVAAAASEALERILRAKKRRRR